MVCVCRLSGNRLAGSLLQHHSPGLVYARDRHSMRAHELAATRSHSRDDARGDFVLGADSAVVMVESADGTTTEVSGLGHTRVYGCDCTQLVMMMHFHDSCRLSTHLQRVVVGAGSCTGSKNVAYVQPSSLQWQSPPHPSHTTQRPPQPCDIDQLHHAIDADAFLRDYLMPQQPVLLRNYATNWRYK